jgi:hypothetical protein
LEYWCFKFISSGDDKKSKKTPGIIRTYGLPFTITATLPSRRCIAVLSDLSVAINCGKATLLSSCINCSN